LGIKLTYALNFLGNFVAAGAAQSLLIISPKFLETGGICMKKFYSLLAAAALTGGLTSAAIATGEDSPTGATGTMSQTGSTTMHSDFQGEHTMEGSITEIDQSEGTLSLKTEEETLELHFPSSALANFKEGDEVKVHLGISKKDASETGTMESEGSPSH
jgi:hypothetical protein